MREEETGRGVAAIGSRQFDLADQTLSDAAGRPVALRPKSARLLSVLASRPGQIFNKTVLMDAVWGDIHVTEDSLTKCIKDIRDALAEDGDRLETVPRRGYRIMATPVAQAGAGGLVIHMAELEDLTGDGRWQRIARGLGRELANTLAVNPSITVITGPGSGDAAGGFELSGDLLAQDGQLRINLRLIDLASGEIAWSDRRTVPDDDVFAMFDMITASATGALSALHTGPHMSVLRTSLRRRAPASLGAFEHWVLGTERLLAFTLGDMRAALEHCRRAREIDPDFSQAWATSATLHHMLMNLEDTRAGRQAHIEPHRRAALRAFELAPDVPAGVLQRAFVSAVDGEMDDAMSWLDRAAALQPNNPDMLSLALIWGGFWCPLEHRAALWRDRMRDLLPRALNFHQHAFGTAAYHLGDNREALRILRDYPLPVMNSLFAVSAAVRVGEAADIEAARDLFEAHTPPDLTVGEVLDAHGTHHPVLRAGLLADAAAAGLAV